MNVLQTSQGLQALRELGICVPEDFDRLRSMPFQAARCRLVELKERVKKEFRRLALELHPDRTNGDEVKTERFKLMIKVKEAVEALQVQSPPPPVIPVVVWNSPHMNFGFGTSTTTTCYHVSPFDGGTGSMSVNAWRVVRIKP